MLEIIWRFGTAVLDSEAELVELLRVTQQLPGMSATQYDLNRKEQWRAFDLQHAAVDALTQRTQLVTIRGATSAQAMFALGKHGEQPTAIVQLPEAPGVVQQLVDGWSALYQALPLESALISSDSWRSALGTAGLATSTGQGSLAIALSWRTGAVPGGVRSMDIRKLRGTPIRLETYETHVALCLAQEPSQATPLVADKAHADALEYVSTCLQPR